MTQERILFAVRDERDYAAALEELDGLILAEPGTPPGLRFNELVKMIDDYAARQSGYILLPRDRNRPQVVQLRPSSLKQRVSKPRKVFERSPG